MDKEDLVSCPYNDIAAIYGDTMHMLDATHSKIPRNNVNPKYNMPFCHQSVFVRTDLLKQHKFDTSFKICADINFFTKIYNDGAAFLGISQVVSCVETNGISSKPNWQLFGESLRIGSLYNRFYSLYFTPKYLTNCFKYILKKSLPSTLSFYLQDRYHTGAFKSYHHAIVHKIARPVRYYHTNTRLRTLKNTHNIQDIVLIYGNTICMLDATHSKIPRNNVNPKYNMPFCHQSVFVRTDLLKQHKFDTSFKICADNDFFTKIYNNGGTFLQCQDIVSYFDGNGISAKPSWQFFKEWATIGSKYNRLFIVYFAPIYFLKSIVKTLFPNKLRLFLQSHYNARPHNKKDID